MRGSNLLFCLWGLLSMLLLMLIYISPVAAGPQPERFVLDDGDSSGHGIKGRIIGTGFGVKEQGSPILHDFATHDYGNGSINTLHQDLVGDLESIPNRRHEEYRWAASPGVRLALSREKRHERSDGHYLGTGSTPRLGWHSEHGGRDSERSAWAGDRHLYFGVWIKILNSTAYTWIIGTDDRSVRDFRYSISGPDDLVTSEAYEVGESILIGDIQGRLIGIHEDLNGFDWMYIEVPGHRRTDALEGKMITGSESGATLVFPTNRTGFSFDEPGYLHTRSRTGRVWQSSSRDGYDAYSFTHVGVAPVEPSTFDQRKYREAFVKAEWHLLEYELSLAQNIDDTEVVAYINGEKLGRSTVGSRIDAWDPTLGGPTIAQIGPNLTDNINAWEIDEVYMDNSRKRVVLANAQTLENATHYEIQTPTDWSNTEIKVRLNYGAFPERQKLYLFVFDGNGRSSERGVSVCSEKCEAAPGQPEAIELSSGGVGD